MLFVTLGTHEQPMMRLVEALERLAIEQPQRGPFEIQHGWTPCPAGWTGSAMMPKPRLIGLMQNADIVIAHGGPATIAEARALGKIPVVIPRLSSCGEQYNDHQVQYAQRLAAAREVVVVTDVDALGEVVREYESLVADFPDPQPRDVSASVRRFVDRIHRFM